MFCKLRTSRVMFDNLPHQSESLMIKGSVFQVDKHDWSNNSRTFFSPFVCLLCNVIINAKRTKIKSEKRTHFLHLNGSEPEIWFSMSLGDFHFPNGALGTVQSYRTFTFVTLITYQIWKMIIISCQSDKNEKLFFKRILIITQTNDFVFCLPRSEAVKKLSETLEWWHVTSALIMMKLIGHFWRDESFVYSQPLFLWLISDKRANLHRQHKVSWRAVKLRINSSLNHQSERFH